MASKFSLKQPQLVTRMPQAMNRTWLKMLQLQLCETLEYGHLLSRSPAIAGNNKIITLRSMRISVSPI